MAVPVPVLASRVATPAVCRLVFCRISIGLGFGGAAGLVRVKVRVRVTWLG